MAEPAAYQPPYTVTPAIVNRIAEISEMLGRHAVLAESAAAPRLRRANRIRSIQASLEIENNTLTIEQVTALIEGKRVLGHPREIQEVHNTYAAYEAMESWQASEKKDFLTAHQLLMQDLVAEAGRYRNGDVGIFRGQQLVHMAPPADRVPTLIANLLTWLKNTPEHPLVSSAICHYEIEFIHPFADGNGRIGRLWQTLILRDWKPVLAYLPIESVIRDRQQDYYDSLALADQRADVTPFIEFILTAIQEAVEDAIESDPVTDLVTDPVAALLNSIGTNTLGTKEIMRALSLSHKPTFRKNYLQPALQANWIERTQPNTPTSPTQRYRLTRKGLDWLSSAGR